MNLYKISTVIADITDRWDSSESPDPALLDEISAVHPEFDDRMNSCNRWLRNLEAESEALKAESQRLAVRKKAIDNQIGWLRSYILKCMKIVGRDKVKTPEFTFSVIKPRSRLEVDESEAWRWSPEFMEAAKAAGAIEEKIVINKTNLKLVPGYLQQPGVSEVLGEEGLQIR